MYIHNIMVYQEVISFLLDIFDPLTIIGPRAGVVKLVDAGDSKSPFPCESVGSIPTSGTK
jgi:hypothetical protein